MKIPLHSPFDRAVKDAMRQAAEHIIMPRYRNLREGDISQKSPGDIVTIADKESEEYLSDALSKILPDAAIVGEEAVYANPDIMDHLSRLCWIIDPIDGTSNFASGEGSFGIMIALAQGGETQAGWIYDPVKDRFCTASKGQGAWVNDEPIKARSSGQTPPFVAAMTGYMTQDQRAIFTREIAPHYQLVKAPGCACEQYPLTIMGANDLAIYERTLPWDHAAGVLFTNEAGGSCLRLDGTAYRVDSKRKGLIGASNHALFDQLADRLQAAGFEPSI